MGNFESAPVAMSDTFSDEAVAGPSSHPFPIHKRTHDAIVKKEPEEDDEETDLNSTIKTETGARFNIFTMADILSERFFHESFCDISL
jgi:hypothetical protein